MKPGILLIDGGGGGGGSFEALRLLALSLRERGFRPAALFFNPVAQQGALEASGVPVAVVEHPWLTRRAGAAVRSRPFPRLARWWPGLAVALERRACAGCLDAMEAFARHHGTDLVHGNTSPVQDLPACWLARRLGVPATGHLRAWPARKPFRAALELANREVAAFAAVGPAVADAWRERGLEAELHVVADGIDPSALGGAAWPSTRLRGSPHFVAALRLVRWKNAGLLLGAMARLLREMPAARLTIFGDGPEREALGAMAREQGVAGAVEFAGHQPDARGQFAHFDALVLPSLNEPGALVLFEAMAAGIPVVALESGGNAAVLDGGRCGLLVPPGDPSALAAAMRRAATDADLRKGLVAAGRERIHGPLHLARHGDAMAAFYRGVLAAAR